MRLSVGEAAELSGVSVRTLHYYDEIGLLRPSVVTEAGYRYYDDEALATLQQILFYRELDFPLGEIKAILSQPAYDRRAALAKQKELLLLKQKRLQRLVGLLDKTMRGEDDVSFTEFDMSEIETAKEKYAKEAEDRWGNTDAYRQSMRRASQYGPDEWKAIKERSDAIFRAFAASVDKDPADPAVQGLVKEWKEHITRYFYACTDEILAGLGDMYVADERFRENIDRYGEGTAAFMTKAIAEYCKK